MAKTGDKSKPSRVRLPPGVEAAFKAADRLQRQLGLSDWQRLYGYLSPDQKAAIKQIETLRREDAQLVEQDVRQRAQIAKQRARIAKHIQDISEQLDYEVKGDWWVKRSALAAPAQNALNDAAVSKQDPAPPEPPPSEPAPASAKPDQVPVPESIPTPASVEHTETPKSELKPGSFGWVYEQVRKDRALTGGDLEPRCEGTVAKKTLQTYVSKARGQLREEEKVSKPKG